MSKKHKEIYCIYINKTNKAYFLVFECPECCGAVPKKITDDMDNNVECEICNKLFIMNKKSVKKVILEYKNYVKKTLRARFL